MPEALVYLFLMETNIYLYFELRAYSSVKVIKLLRCISKEWMSIQKNHFTAK